MYYIRKIKTKKNWKERNGNIVLNDYKQIFSVLKYISNILYIKTKQL